MAKNISCNLCGVDQTSIVLADKAKGFCFARTVVRCEQCWLLFVNPQPEWEELVKAYDFYSGTKAAETAPNQEISNERIFRRVKLLKNIASSKNALDLGCGNGGFLFSLRQAGVKCRGVEASSRLAGLARGKGLEVFTGTIENFCRDSENESFDLVTMWEVIEHLRDPAGAVKRIFDILKPGGILALSTPNAAGTAARRKQMNWQGFTDDRCHLFFFNRQNLRDLLIPQGFLIKKLFTKKISQTLFKPFVFAGLGNEIEVYAQKPA